MRPGKTNQNTFDERFNRSFRDDVLDANLFNSISEAQEAADVWGTDYNEFRILSPLVTKLPWSSGQGYLNHESLWDVYAPSGVTDDDTEPSSMSKQ